MWTRARTNWWSWHGMEMTCSTLLQLKAGSSILFLLGGDGNDTLIGGASAARLFGGNAEGEDRGIDTAQLFGVERQRQCQPRHRQGERRPC